jgi:hypothetical protein
VETNFEIKWVSNHARKHNIKIKKGDTYTKINGHRSACLSFNGDGLDVSVIEMKQNNKQWMEVSKKNNVPRKTK